MPTTSTSTSSSTSTSASSSASKIISTLGAGSGVDLKSLANSLVDAEFSPRKDLINGDISKCNSRISGYSSLMYILSSFKDAFAALQDQTTLNTSSATSSASTYVGATATSAASAGSHQISVSKLAVAQRGISTGFSSRTTDLGLNSSSAFYLNVTVGSSTTAVTIPANATLNDIATAINDASAGVTAQVINTGSSSTPYKLVMTADDTGSDGAFTTTTTDTSGSTLTGTGLEFSQTASSTGEEGILQDAVDASLTVDGVPLTRSSNVVSDAVDGLTLNLLNTTSSAATVTVSRDTSAIKANLQKLVSAYNDVQTVLNTVSDPKSTVPNMGNTLVGNSLVNTLRSQVAALVTGTSSTPGSSITALRDLGITLQSDGTMALDSTSLVDSSGATWVSGTSSGASQTKLDWALNQHFSEVVKMFSGNADHSPDNAVDAVMTTYNVGNRGLAGDAVKSLLTLMNRSGPIVTASDGATAQITRDNTRLSDVQTQMQMALDRYTKQFTAMDTLVGQLNSMKTSLANQFNAMLGVKSN